jgi:glycosyltransferase involved in cell wall biosynthesis
VAFAGRLVEVKRPQWFAQAVPQVPGAVGLVFGDGPLRSELLAAGRGRLRLLGTRPDLADLLAGCDALMIPSRREGCPLVAVEAFAAGVPVVGIDVPGVRDVLALWGAGRLVAEALGPAGLAAAAREVLAAETRDALVDRARSGLPRFAPAAVAARLAAEYAAALARRAGAAARGSTATLAARASTLQPLAGPVPPPPAPP